MHDALSYPRPLMKAKGPTRDLTLHIYMVRQPSNNQAHNMSPNPSCFLPQHPYPHSISAQTMQYQMPTQDSDEDSDIEVMPSARWKFGRREKPYSENGSILLDASDTTRNALVEAEKLTEPSTSTHPFPRGEIRDPVFWKNIDGGVSKATLCIRKLGPKEPTLSDTVVEDPCDRDVFYAAVRLDGDGIGETEFDPTTTYVTDQGRFEVSMIPGSLQSSLLETSVTALHTGTTYMVRPAGDSVQCVRTRDFQPPVSSITLLLSMTN